MKRRKTSEEEKVVETDDEVGKIVSLFSIPGGRPARGSSDGGDWLSALDIGTYFLCGDKRSADPYLTEYSILDKTSVSVQLEIDVVDKKINKWVIPSRFCQINFLHEILGVFKDG